VAVAGPQQFGVLQWTLGTIFGNFWGVWIFMDILFMDLFGFILMDIYGYLILDVDAGGKNRPIFDRVVWVGVGY
jgi:hypothetical protein